MQKFINKGALIKKKYSILNKWIKIKENEENIHFIYFSNIAQKRK
jgi:hypothetical protein